MGALRSAKPVQTWAVIGASERPPRPVPTFSTGWAVFETRSPAVGASFEASSSCAADATSMKVGTGYARHDRLGVLQQVVPHPEVDLRRVGHAQAFQDMQHF